MLQTHDDIDAADDMSMCAVSILMIAFIWDVHVCVPDNAHDALTSKII